MMFGQQMMGVQPMPGQQGQTMVPVGMVPTGAQGGQTAGMQMNPMFTNMPDNQQWVMMMPIMMTPGGQGFVPNQNFMQQQGMPDQAGNMIQQPMYHQPNNTA